MSLNKKNLMKGKKINDSKLLPYLLIGYGGLIILGGSIGYLKGGSLISLVTGLASGLWVLSGAVGIWQDRWGSFWLSGIALITVIGFFGYRLWATGKWAPFGLLSITGLILLVILVKVIIRSSRSL